MADRPTTKLASPKVRVTLEGRADPFELQTINADLVLWDRTAFKHKWPKFDDAPFLWLTFLSWSAARRTGEIGTDLTYEKWEASVQSVEAVDTEADDAIPTSTGPAPD
jgi:hypothetical protein